MPTFKPSYIYNTRPGTKGQKLSKLLSKSGYEVYSQPIQTISPLVIDQGYIEKLKNISSAWIFISPSAVDCFFSQVKLDDLDLKYKPLLLAVGSGTKDQIYKYFPNADIIYPKEDHGAQALLEQLNNHQLNINHYFIFRGKTGSALLYDTLSQVSQVESIICYQRITNNEIIDGNLNRLFLAHQPDIIITTSFEALEELNRYYANANWLKHALITVTSKRMLTWANKQGFKRTLLLKSLDNESILNAVQKLS
ncbi:uroporphyrinogen-III synthase [Thiotrichales bacterium 19S9-12]|nr:uroporphyrinogen-III synthase [Thiotrichales bacterium 19S9-11]MCF6812241.1 uroporphyrinogen-III synthase [Thiotrichales bacterium 19S9-12]